MRWRGVCLCVQGILSNYQLQTSFSQVISIEKQKCCWKCRMCKDDEVVVVGSREERCRSCKPGMRPSANRKGERERRKQAPNFVLISQFAGGSCMTSKERLNFVFYRKFKRKKTVKDLIIDR